ncbi:WD40-repeat-containing domain protein [Chlamydoabsidia padenii]|nr:WD40-repeat-containing domain protein [Chlamydoabsidia padenii]
MDNTLSSRLTGSAIAVRDKAMGLATIAHTWLHPVTHFESLTTVMFSPLAAHPVYRSESMVKAIHLAQQHQRPSLGSELVLHVNTTSCHPWPSSSTLLEADIPEPTLPLSLFQGFATTYPSLTSKTLPRKSTQRKKQQHLDSNTLADQPGSLKRIYAERERKLYESDKLEMQMTSTSNEIRQIDMQIDELINKRKTLETKWTKLEGKEQELQLKIEELTKKIMDETGDSHSTTKLSQSEYDDNDNDYNDNNDDEYDFGECIKSLHGHEGGILCVDFDHAKGTLVSSSLDDTLRVWDLDKGQYCGQLQGHANLVRCLQLDGRRLLTGADDGIIKQWDLTDFGKDSTTLDSYCLSSFEDHQGKITAIHADASHLVSGSNDKTMKLWDLETQNCVLTMDVMWASSGSNNSLFQYINMTSPSTDYIGALQFWNFALASGTTDGKLRMWDLRTGQPHRTLPGHKGAITALQFDDIHLVSGSVDKTIQVWDLRTGSVFDTLTFTDPVSSLRFDSGKIISAAYTIDIYNRTSFQHSKLSGGSVDTLQYKNDVLASGGNDKVITLWAM